MKVRVRKLFRIFPDKSYSCKTRLLSSFQWTIIGPKLEKSPFLMIYKLRTKLPSKLQKNLKKSRKVHFRGQWFITARIRFEERRLELFLVQVVYVFAGANKWLKKFEKNFRKFFEKVDSKIERTRLEIWGGGWTNEFVHRN